MQELKQLKETLADKTELEAVRRELLKTIDAVNIEGLETKTHIWDLETKLNQK
jgi:hypothetical protein